MRRKSLWLGLVVLVMAAVTAWMTYGMGFTARATPSRSEAFVLRSARRWATPSAIRRQANPVPATGEVIRSAMTHWADHCATCHANDGSGQTPIGRNLYPPAPDMRGGPTQELTDGELFYVIERGVPITGMPAWGNGTTEGEQASWALVRFVRYLPHLTEKEIEEMEKLNPQSPAAVEQEKHIHDFLNGK